MRTTRFWLWVFWALAGLLTGCAETPQKREAVRELVFPSPPDEARFVFERSIYTSADVLEKDKNSLLRQALTGEGERGGEGMQKPYGIAVREGRVYVTDPVAQSVKLFDIPGKKFISIGADDQDQLVQPLGLDIDAQQNLYVVDAVTKHVKVYDAQGKFLRLMGGAKMLSRPSGVAVSADGERVYVVDTGGVQRQEEHRVRVFNGRTGTHLFDFGKRGSGDGEFNLARDIAIAPNGRLYVVDTGNFRVQVFDRDGKFVKAFGSVGRQPGNFARPREIAIDREGRVYVSDAAFGNMQIFDAEGELLMHIGDRAERDQPARYMLPSGLAVDGDGRIYIADEFFRRVDVFRPAALKAHEGYSSSAAPARKAEAGVKPR
ncbi:MAG: 6-bladed beta-propeller [Betaproteobacteria bacterium]|nr:6-bladed beta-propeller [Betaproteobacteria bacterium]